MPNNLAVGLQKKFRECWLPWPTPYSLRLGDHLAHASERKDAVYIIEKTHFISTGSTQAKLFWKQLETFLIDLIHGSNFIESAGTGIRATTQICRSLFNGEPQDINLAIDETDPLYQEHIDHLLETNRTPTRENIIHSRKEVISHAKALSYMISEVILKSAPWSEELILSTHHILHADLEDSASHVTPGQYRTHEVAISYSNPDRRSKRKISRCMRASAVPSYMTTLLRNLNHELNSLSQTSPSTLDPYTLAARYAHHFVMIHPFGDGNGRMSRIILNTLLLQFAGHVAVMGGGEGEKRMYLDVVDGAARVFRREDMEVEFWEQRSHLEFARFVFEKSRGSLKMMGGWVSE